MIMAEYSQVSHTITQWMTSRPQESRPAISATPEELRRLGLMSSDQLAQLWEIDSNTREEMSQAIQMLHVVYPTGQTVEQMEENTRYIFGRPESNVADPAQDLQNQPRKTTRYKILRESVKSKKGP